MTQIVSGLFGSMGFRTGALHVNDLIDSKHLSSSGVQMNGFPL